MTRIEAFHLPGLGRPAFTLRSLAGTELEIPRLDAEDVDTVWRALDAGASRWRLRSLAARGETLARVAADLRRDGPGPWREWLARSAGLSPSGFDAAWDATFAPWDGPGIAALLRSQRVEEVSPSRWPNRVAHVLAGNVLPPTFAMLARGFIAGAAQWMRPASREPLFAACLAAHLREHEPELADSCAVLWWEHGEPVEAAVLAGADVVTVQGEDAAVHAVRSRLETVAPRARCVGYGSRWSAALLAHDALTESNARGLARDVALFDQHGCLSPSLVLAERGPRLEPWCAALAQGLCEAERSMPRGRLSESARAGLRLWHENVRLGVALGVARGLWASDGTAWAVALFEGPRFDASPLDRHVPVVPFGSIEELEEVVGPRAATLQGLAADLAGWDAARRDRALGILRPTRVSRPGELQLAPPDWPQDHLPPLRSLLVE